MFFKAAVTILNIVRGCMYSWVKFKQGGSGKNLIMYKNQPDAKATPECPALPVWKAERWRQQHFPQADSSAVLVVSANSRPVIFAGALIPCSPSAENLHCSQSWPGADRVVEANSTKRLLRLVIQVWVLKLLFLMWLYWGLNLQKTALQLLWDFIPY